MRLTIKRLFRPAENCFPLPQPTSRGSDTRYSLSPSGNGRPLPHSGRPTSTPMPDDWIENCTVETFPLRTAHTEAWVPSSRCTQKASVQGESCTHGTALWALVFHHSPRLTPLPDARSAAEY